MIESINKRIDEVEDDEKVLVEIDLERFRC